jgi:hypothetical protein
MFCYSTEIKTDLMFDLVYSFLPPKNVYSSSLSMNNQIYSRDCDNQSRYYESMQVKVNTTGYYSFLSHSSMNAYGFIYINTFNPLNPLQNLFHADDDSGSSLQFKLNVRLNGGMTYVLVMTTNWLKEIGSFSIIVSGDNKVILQHLRKYRYTFIVCLSCILGEYY